MEKPEETFQDPLEDYDPKEFSDPFERALAEESVSQLVSGPFLSVAQDTSIQAALELLDERDVGCLMVEEDGHLVGIFSDWDALHNVVLGYDLEQREATPIKAVMTKDPAFVFDFDTVAAVLSAMETCGCRHVPVLDAEDKRIVGIINPQKLMSFLRDRAHASDRR